MGSNNYFKGNSGYNGGVGRINVIAVDPKISSKIYAGSPAGGLWRTTNSGSTWSPLTDELACWGVSGIAINHWDQDTLYILTGDGDGGQTPCLGVMRSTDNGNTWNPTGLGFDANQYALGYKLLMHPSNPNILYAATNKGLYKTVNAGASWARMQSDAIQDVEFKPNNPNTLYIAAGTRVWRSTNSGSTWDVRLSVPGVQRIALGVSPANSNYVYALVGDGDGLVGLYASTNSGFSFSQRSNSPNILGYDPNGNDDRSQAYYDLAIAVSPTNVNVIHTGGINCWKSTNGGYNWNITSYWYEGTAGYQYTHADIHELVLQWHLVLRQ